VCDGRFGAVWVMGMRRFGLYLRLDGRAFGACHIPVGRLLERLGVFGSVPFCLLVSLIVRGFLSVLLSVLLSGMSIFSI